MPGGNILCLLRPLLGPRSLRESTEHSKPFLGASCLLYTSVVVFLVNCAEYFPLFVSMLWVASLYFSQAFLKFRNCIKKETQKQRLAPMYFSARVLWLLIGFSTVGVLSDLSRIYFGVAFLHGLKVFLRSYWIPF
ncbi:UNVERIFIED_CONTAM: hypothetical protein FKN15_012252 [Acipenser sinensis]